MVNRLPTYKSKKPTRKFKMSEHIKKGQRQNTRVIPIVTDSSDSDYGVEDKEDSVEMVNLNLNGIMPAPIEANKLSISSLPSP